MVHDPQHRRVGTTSHTQVDWPGRLWLWSIALAMLLVSSGLLAGGTYAAQRARPFLIGALTRAWGPTPHIAGLRDGLVALGYREDAQFVIGVRFTQGDTAALPEAARQLVHYGVDILFAAGPIDVAQAAQRATTQIPIVFSSGGGDPLQSGLIQSFARPGGNITGVTSLGLALSPKRLQIFRELIPDLKRVLFLYDANHGPSVAAAQVYRDAARRLGMVLVERTVRTEHEAQTALAQIHQGTVDGILAPHAASLNIPGFILQVASQRIPTMFAFASDLEQGGLASYASNLYDSGRQAARLVDKILKGADPGELPIEVNSKVEFVINLKTAKTLGITIAPEVLFQANRVLR